MSPARMWTMPAPRDWTRPAPSVTYSVCPSAWECHAVRAPGVKRTALTRTRDGSSPRAIWSSHTSPVKLSGEPLTLACLGFLSIHVSLSVSAVGRSGPHKYLERLAIGHCPIPVGNIVQADRSIKHTARLQSAFEDIRKQ